MTTKIREDTAHTVEVYSGTLAKADSCTVSVYDAGGTEIVTDDGATVDALSTTVATAASIGAQEVVLASASGLTIGDRYLLTQAGVVEVVEALAVSGSTVKIDRELGAALDVGATFISYKISYDLTASETETVGGPYRVEWTVVHGSATTIVDTLYDVVAEEEWLPTTGVDLGIYPSVNTYMTANSLDAQTLLDRAWNYKLKPKLISKKIELSRVKDKDQVVPVHVAYALLLIAEDRAKADVEHAQALEDARQEAVDQLDMLLASPSWYDENQDEVAQADEVKQDKRPSRMVLT